MGRKAKKRQQKKLWEQCPEGTVICFIAKEHYSEEWPNSSLKVHSGGIFPIDVRGTEISILGHWFTVYAEGQEFQGIYGPRLFRPGEEGNEGIYINAITPTSAEELKPYLGLIQGLIGDMVRNHVIPSWDELRDRAVKDGLISPPLAEVG